MVSNVCSKTDGVGTPSDQPALLHSNTLTEKNPPPGPNPLAWTVKVINGSVASLPYAFSVVSGGATLTGLTVSGPATINEGNVGTFTAKAQLSDGTTPTVTPVWGVAGGSASISANGVVSTGTVSSDTSASVTASYLAGGITKTATANFTILNVAAGGGTPQVVELLQNGGFENGTTGWNMSGPIVASSYPHTGSKYAVMAETALSVDQLWQQIAIPANASSVTFSYWVNIVSAETGGTPYDVMSVSLLNTSGGNIALLDTRSNVNKDSAAGSAYYHQRTCDLTPYRGQTVRLSFLSTTDANTVTSFKIDDVSVQAVIPPGGSLASLAIQGPSSVREGATGDYTATATYSDGSLRDVIASWSVGSSYATIESNGVLRANTVTANQVVPVAATYTEGGITRSSSIDVTITNVAASYQYIVINGPTEVNENSQQQYTATAIFSDGTTQTVNATWEQNSSVASFSNAGVLTTGEVPGDSVITLSATYYIGLTYRKIWQDVRIVNVAVPPTVVSIQIDGPAALTEGTVAQYTATAILSDGTTQAVNPVWTEDSTITTISGFGLLSAGSLTADTTANVTATYTVGPATHSTSKAVTIVNAPENGGFVVTPGTGAHGTISPGTPQTVTSGGSLTFTASPSTGYLVDQWFLNGNVVQTGETTYSLGSIMGNQTVQVTFRATDPDSNMDYRWAVRGGGTGEDVGQGVCLDASGNVFTTGYFFGTADFSGVGVNSQGDGDIFLAKHNADGQVQWVKAFGSAGFDRGIGIASGAGGRLYVVGTCSGAFAFGGGVNLTQPGLFVACFDSNGDIVWARTYGGTSGPFAHRIAVDGTGNLVMAGAFKGSVDFGTGTLTSTGDWDVFLMQLNDNDGSPRWVRRAGGTQMDVAYGLALDAQNRIYIVGTTRSWSTAFDSVVLNRSSGRYNAFMAVYDTSGNIQWATSYGVQGTNYAKSVAVAPNGDIYLAGVYRDTPTFGSATLSTKYADFFLVKTDSQGTAQWVREFGNNSTQDGGFFGTDYAKDIGLAFDYRGNIVYSATFSGTINFGTTSLSAAQDVDIVTAKLTPSGNYIWANQGGADVAGWPCDLVISPTGIIYQTGQFMTSALFSASSVTSMGDKDYFLARISEPIIALADIAGPALAVTSPGTNMTVTTSSVTITGTASDGGRGNNGVLSVTVNGANATGGTSSGQNSANWSVTVTLSPGANTLTILVKDSLNNSTQQQIALYYSATPHEQWRFAKFGADYVNLTISGDTADPDGDGISNLMERALGLEPRQANRSGMPRTGIEKVGINSYLTFTHRELIGASDLKYTVEVSDDLKIWDWTENQLDPIPTIVPTGDGLTEEVTERLSTPINALSGRRFLRLKVAQLPN